LQSVNIPVGTRTLSSQSGDPGESSVSDMEIEEAGVHAEDLVSPSSIAMLTTSIRGGLTFGDDQIVQGTNERFIVFNFLTRPFF